MHCLLQATIAVILLILIFLAYDMGKKSGVIQESMKPKDMEMMCGKCGETFVADEVCDKCKLSPKNYNLMTANPDRKPWEPKDSKQTGFEVANYVAGLDSIMYKDWQNMQLEPPYNG